MADNFFKVRNGLNFGSLPTAPSNPQNGDVYYDTTLNKFQRYENGAWGAFGSGSGSGGVNYLATPTDNSSFDSNIGNWVAYADAAGVQPVDGTGGSPVTTITQSSSSPLRGNGSGLITKDAANRQGEGVSVNFTIDKADEAKLLSIQFDYIVSSGTFNAGSDSQDSDIEVWIYDVTNAVLIPSTPFKLVSNSTVTAGTFKSVFQTNSNSISYRLILHIPTTNASAWVLKVDNFSVGPQVILNAPSIGDWQDYTVLITSTGSAPTPGTNTRFVSKWRRVGDSIELHFDLAYNSGGSAGSGTYLFSLPSGLSIDPNKTFNSSTDTAGYCGAGKIDNATSFKSVVAMTYDATHFSIKELSQTGLNNNFTDVSSSDFPFSGAFNLTLNVKLPILGWSSNTITGNDSDSRVVAANIEQSVNYSATTGTDIVFNTVVFDTHGAYNATTGQYKVPTSGKYKCGFTATTTAGSAGIFLLKNGTAYQFLTSITASSVMAGETTIDCVSGDLLTFRVDTNTTIVGAGAPNIAHMSFERLSGPALPLASETVAFSVSDSSGQSTSSTSPAQLTFSTIDFDTHGAYNTGTNTYVIPISGIYDFIVQVKYPNTQTWATAGDGITTMIYKNGVLYKSIANFSIDAAITTTEGKIAHGGVKVSCIAGDSITALYIKSQAGAVSAIADAHDVYFQGSRIGNS